MALLTNEPLTYSDRSLRDIILKKTTERLINAKNNNAIKYAYLQSILDHFDEVMDLIDTHTGRTEAETNSFPGNFCAAFQYALLKTSVDIEKYYEVSSPEKWWKIISTELMDSNILKVFSENIWRPPAVVRPRRAVPLRYVLAHHFGNSSIIGADIGGGLHVVLPNINIDIFSECPNFPLKQSLRSTKIDIATGYCFDIQKERDLEWAIASEDPGANAAQNVQELKLLYKIACEKKEHFPYVSKSIFENLELPEQLDFVFASFVLHQNHPFEDRALARFGEIVKEGGICVVIGQELYDPPALWQYGAYNVNVYTIKNKTPVLIGTPFVLKGDQATVKEVNNDYFLNTGIQRLYI